MGNGITYHIEVSVVSIIALKGHRFFKLAYDEKDSITGIKRFSYQIAVSVVTIAITPPP
jgi:hypothetical protein